MSPEVYIIVIILAVPIYLLSKWVLKKMKIGTIKNRKFLALIPTAILSPILYVGIIMIWIFSMAYYPKSDFDQHEWMVNQEERYKMTDDIIESEFLIGKTKEEVMELLGKDFYSYNENHMAYDLGFVPGLFNIDPDVLDIYFKDGIVIKVIQHET